MPSSSDNYIELFALADDVCNGVADDGRCSRLEAIINGDAAARRAYLRYVSLHAELSLSDCDVADHAWRAIRGNRERRRIASPRANGAAAVRSGQARLSQRASSGVVRRLSAGLGRRTASYAFVTAAAVMACAYWAGIAHLADYRPAPFPIAQVSAVRNCRWVGDSARRELGVGDVVYANQRLHLYDGQAELQFTSGAKLTLDGPVEVIPATPFNCRLQAGKVDALVPRSAVGFTVSTPSVQVVDRGTEFSVVVDDAGDTVVDVSQGLVEVTPRAPRHFWSFDEAGGSFRDQSGTRFARLSPMATRVDGLVGPGGVRFNNTVGAAVYLGNGDAAGAQSGSFAARSGVTIEALIVSEWTGLAYDYDHIFRKEDGDHRLLLALQNPASLVGIPSQPEVPQGPCLAFGLRIEGQPYQELDMPLDGNRGRPSLADICDGDVHHIVAAYDAATGEKRLYVDGRLCMTAWYPPGAQVICGGMESAVVGGCARHVDQTFRGVIDEVAWYDFALNEEEVARHYRNVLAGKDYFGSPEKRDTVSTELRAGESMRFDAATGTPVAPDSPVAASPTS